MNAQPEDRDNLFLDLEEIDPSELNLFDDDSIPLVQAAAEKKKGFGFFRALLWCLLFLVITQGLVGAMVIAVLLLLILTGSVDPKELTMGHPAFQAIIQVVTVLAPLSGAIFSILAMRKVIGSDWRRQIGLRAPHLEHIVLVLIAFPAFEVLITSMEPTVVKDIPEAFDMKNFMNMLATWPWWLSLVAIAVGPGISEELFCRGFLGWGLTARYGTIAAVGLTSFLFGLIHLNPPQAVIAMLLGLILHSIYLCSRSLWVPIMLHFLHNGLLILNDSQSLPVPFFKSLELTVLIEPIWFPRAAALLAVVSAVALYQCRIRVRLPNGLALTENRALIPRGLGVSLVPGPLHPGVVIALTFSAALFAWLWLGI